MALLISARLGSRAEPARERAAEARRQPPVASPPPVGRSRWAGARWRREVRATPFGHGAEWLVRSLLAALLAGSGGCHTVFDGELGAVGCEAEGAYGPPACRAGETCVASVCAALGAPLGAPCSSDDACRAPGWCLDPAILGLPGAPRCTQPCCSSAECGPTAGGQVCFAPFETAGALCWPGAELGRATPGDAPAGVPCGDGSECRSGRCEKTCTDVCCGDASCGDGTICRLRFDSATGEQGWSCGMPPTAADAQICYADADCRRGRCAPFEALDAALCLEPCCSSLECDAVEIDGVTQRFGCAPGPGGVRACARPLPPGAKGAVGTQCDGGAQCRSGLCIDGMCSDLCCDDASCGDPMRFACRLGEVDGVSALRCIRK